MTEPLDAPTPPAPPPTPEEIRARQIGRAKVMAWLLLGFVVLVVAISIVKMQVVHVL